jgi:dCMP deaminase
MAMALAAGARSTCQRRMVGCILVDINGRVIGTGYNGVPRDEPHCLDEPCLAVGMQSGEGLDLCRAIHAEINALSHCKDTLAIETVYCTAYPCIHCLKPLINTTAKHLYYMHDYPNSIVGQGISCTKLISPILDVIEAVYAEQRTGQYTAQREGSTQLGIIAAVDAAIGASRSDEYQGPSAGHGDV